MNFLLTIIVDIQKTLDNFLSIVFQVTVYLYWNRK